MGGLKKFVIAAAVSAFAWTPSPTGADVDAFGVWIFSLYYRDSKVIITRQTTNPGPGPSAVGGLLTADGEFVGK